MDFWCSNCLESNTQYLNDTEFAFVLGSFFRSSRVARLRKFQQSLTVKVLKIVLLQITLGPLGLSPLGPNLLVVLKNTQNLIILSSFVLSGTPALNVRVVNYAVDC